MSRPSVCVGHKYIRELGRGSVLVCLSQRKYLRNAIVCDRCAEGPGAQLRSETAFFFGLRNSASREQPSLRNRNRSSPVGNVVSTCR